MWHLERESIFLPISTIEGTILMKAIILAAGRGSRMKSLLTIDPNVG